MADGVAVLERLRGRLAALEAHQRATGGTADAAFWASLMGQEAGRRGGPAEAPDAPGPGVTPRHRRGGRRACTTSRSNGGPWSEALGDADDVLAGVDPREVAWLTDDDLADPAFEPVDPFAGSGSGAGTGSEPEPVEVMLDAVVGMPLTRHHADELTRAGEWVAHRLASHEVMLVNVVAELEARGVEAPGGLSRVDWLRVHAPGLSAGQAKAVVTVGTAFGRELRQVDGPRQWDALRALVSRQQVTVSNAGSGRRLPRADQPRGRPGRSR